MTVYVCVHMPRECVCERKDVHAYCSKMLAAQQKQDYALAELWRGGGGLCKVESLKSAEKWQCRSVFKMESRKLPPCSTEAMVGRPKDRQRELRPDKVQLLQKQLQATRIQTGFFWCCRMRYTCFPSALF